MNKIAEIINETVEAETMDELGHWDSVTLSNVDQAAAEILALIPANMEVPALEDGAGSTERRNLILGRNAGLSEARKALEGK